MFFSFHHALCKLSNQKLKIFRCFNVLPKDCSTYVIYTLFKITSKKGFCNCWANWCFNTDRDIFNIVLCTARISAMRFLSLTEIVNLWHNEKNRRRGVLLWFLKVMRKIERKEWLNKYFKTNCNKLWQQQHL